MNKNLPQNIEAECAVLGSLIIDPEAMAEVRDTGLQASDFYRDAHRTLYENMLVLSLSGTPADFITLCDYLETKDQLKAVGGADYITSLVNQVPTSGNATAYASIVVTKSRLRQYILFAGKLAATAYEELEVPEIQKTLEAFTYKMGVAQDGGGRLFELRELVKDYADSLGKLTAEMENRPEGAPIITGVPSGFPTFDTYSAGFRCGDLITIAGLTGAGKTSFMLTMAYLMARMGLSVALFSLEMPKEQLVQRFLSMDTMIPGEKLMRVTLDDEDWTKITTAIGSEMGSGIWISDLTLIDPALIRSRAQWLRAQHGIHAIFVDYLQLAQATVSGKRIENRVQEVTEISRQLKILATDLDLPVIAAAQLSREVMHQQKKIPTLAHLRESGGIEQNSAVVIFLYREDMDAHVMADIKHPKAGLTTVIVAKNRHLHPAELSLFYHGPTTRFMELEEAAERGFVHLVGDTWFARPIDTRFAPPTTTTHYTPYEEDPDDND